MLKIKKDRNRMSEKEIRAKYIKMLPESVVDEIMAKKSLSDTLDDLIKAEKPAEKAKAKPQKASKKPAAKKADPKQDKIKKIHAKVGEKHLKERSDKEKEKKTHKENSHVEKIADAHKELSGFNKKGWQGTADQGSAKQKHLSAVQNCANQLADPLSDPKGHHKAMKKLHAAGSDKKAINEILSKGFKDFARAKKESKAEARKNDPDNTEESLKVVTQKSQLDNLVDFIKGGPGSGHRAIKTSRVKGYPTTQEMDKRKKDIKTLGPKTKSSFIKKSGAGGVVMDFGFKTGNPIADNFSEVMQQHGQAEQMGVAKSQDKSYYDAISEFVEKGEQQFNKEKNGGESDGQVATGWDNQLNNMDANCAEALQKGELNVNNNMVSRPDSPTFNKSEFEEHQTMVNGELVKAQSETDAALIRMMNQNMAGSDTVGGTEVELGGSGNGITIDTSSGKAFGGDGGELKLSEGKSEPIVTMQESTPVVPQNVLTL